MAELEYYVKLLENNKNIILHGAPGTGKTYLAKDIAAKMICGKKYAEIKSGSDDEKKFNECTEFVQFHPSYDYTDFVEGLRPIEGENPGDVGFERKDGVFKEFCEKALENYSNHKKGEDVLKQELTNKEIIDSFLSDAKENGTEFKTLMNNTFYIEEFNNRHVVVSYKRRDSTNYRRLKIKYSDFLALFKYGKEQKNENKDEDIIKLKEVHTKLGRDVQQQVDSYSSVLINELLKKEESNNKSYSGDVDKELKNYVFIIDEINRGEISKIFGELFFSIDPDYRGQQGRVRTQYANMLDETNEFDDALNITDSYGHFFVPENVYIIGTMNDIDKSVESMDFAMRRRFIFKEVTAEESAINMGLEETQKAYMKRVNDKISATEGLNSSYHIGGAYFIGVNDENDLKELWDLKLSSLVKEYLRGMDDYNSKFKAIENEYYGNNTNTNDATEQA